MIFVSILAPVTMSPRDSGAHVALLQNSAGRTSKAPYFRWAHFEGSQIARGKFAINFCPRNFGAFKVRLAELWTFKVRPAEFWSNATCAPLFHGDIVMYARLSMKNHLKLRLAQFCKVIFVNCCHFKDLYIYRD